MLFDISESPRDKKSNEWYTPLAVIKAARDVMGSIDLDPASCEMANKTVRASRYYIACILIVLGASQKR